MRFSDDDDDDGIVDVFCVMENSDIHTRIGTHSSVNDTQLNRNFARKKNMIQEQRKYTENYAALIHWN